ncbi:hypothetical protein [Streptomyces sp. NPDC002599]|uniref:hypothetical protein n=1 Tax=Streptomyces sp. NPDC002599 TaxID=3154421 RepID=UPI00331CA042
MHESQLIGTWRARKCPTTLTLSAAGNADAQQQALKDFAAAKNARFASGFGEPSWRKKFVHEGFRVIGTDRVPE